MRLPLVYHDDYSPPFPASHRFPMEKFRLLRDHLIDSGLSTDAELLRPELCPAEVLALAHCPAYIQRFASGVTECLQAWLAGQPLVRVVS